MLLVLFILLLPRLGKAQADNWVLYPYNISFTGLTPAAALLPTGSGSVPLNSQPSNAAYDVAGNLLFT